MLATLSESYVLCSVVAGLSMRMTYFVGPYDLVDKSAQTLHPMTAEGILETLRYYSYIDVPLIRFVFNLVCLQVLLSLAMDSKQFLIPH